MFASFPCGALMLFPCIWGFSPGNGVVSHSQMKLLIWKLSPCKLFVCVCPSGDNNIILLIIICLARTAVVNWIKMPSKSLSSFSYWAASSILHSKDLPAFLTLSALLWLFQLPYTGIMGSATLIAGTGSIRGWAHALGSIPLGLASAGSHSAPVSQGLYAFNTPPWCQGTINPRLLGITVQFMSFDWDQLDPKVVWNSTYVKVGAHFCMCEGWVSFTLLCNTEEFSHTFAVNVP